MFAVSETAKIRRARTARSTTSWCLVPGCDKPEEFVVRFVSFVSSWSLVPQSNPNRGIALIVVLLVSSLVFVLALGLSLVTAVDHLSMRNYRESAALLYAAEGAVELAARALSESPSWDAVLSGLAQADGADGPPWGTREHGGIRVDLSAQTSLVNCGQAGGCSAADLQASTADRPFGANNPHWRLFLYGPHQSLASWRYPAPAYILLWIGDDGREVDGDPERDGGGPAGEGGGVVRVRADAFGRDGGRRAVEAELSRICPRAEGGPACLPGIRVQSWRDVRHAIP